MVGLKPTYGRVSRYGVFPLAKSLDNVGPIARRVADAAAILGVIAGHDPDDPTSSHWACPTMWPYSDQGPLGAACASALTSTSSAKACTPR